MESNAPPIAPLGATSTDSGTAVIAQERLTALAQLLSDLDPAPRPAPEGGALEFTPGQQDALVQARLGIASSLFTALKWKHEPTARHCLRVALGCSAWIHRIGLPENRCNDIEVAALLHDIGKIGVPDHILTKAGPLTPPEAAVVESHWLIGLEILRRCCAAQSVQDILLSTSAWFDGSKKSCPGIGENIPLGSRIVAIVDAFDSMTNEHEYRAALSREQAFEELQRGAGRQFDPRLVKSFCELHERDEAKLRELVPRRWLEQLDPAEVNQVWQLNDRPAQMAQREYLPLFRERLIEGNEDAVIFLDASLQIVGWNAAAERLTGMLAQDIQLRRWVPSLLRLCDEYDCLIRDEECPFAYALQTLTPWAGRLTLHGPQDHAVVVNAYAMPVTGEDGIARGVAVQMRDSSPETLTSQRRMALQDIALRDNLTQLANRAAFDREFNEVVAAQAANKRPASLIIADIDHLQQVNDDYGHWAGDEILRRFAALLKGSCRKGDLVARYGGEEFAILYIDCPGDTVAHRAEQVRAAFGSLPHDGLNGATVTVSFGVTEIQPGDTADTMLRRAERALSLAKQEGRDRVVRLGTGLESANKPLRKLRCKFAAGESVLERHLASQVPLAVSVEKLRGFIADHHAEVVELHATRIVLAITCGPPVRSLLVNTERPSRFTMELDLREERATSGSPWGRPGDTLARTLIKVVIRPEKTRDRRRKLIDDRAQKLLMSLRAYLMAVDPVEGESGVLQRAKNLFTPWWAQK